MLFSSWTLLTASAEPTSRLAPGPAELGAAQAELEARLVVAEAVGVAVARLQGAHSNLSGKGPACDDPARAESLTRLRHFADRWHDGVQRAVVQAERLRWISVAPTIAPIVDEERRAALAALEVRADRLEAEWLELFAWFQQTAPRACKAVELTSFAGLPLPSIQAADDVPGATAVTALRGFVCPERGEPVPGTGDLVLLGGRACWSADAACGCDQTIVHPGAVLGPEAPKAPPEAVAAQELAAPAPEGPVEEAGPGEPVAPAGSAEERLPEDDGH